MEEKNLKRNGSTGIGEASWKVVLTLMVKNGIGCANVGEDRGLDMVGDKGGIR